MGNGLEMSQLIDGHTFDTCPYCTDTEMKSGRIQVKGHGLETSTKIRPVECG